MPPRRSPWWAKRLHPVGRYGASMLVDGVKQGSNGRTGTGLAMIAAGWALKRRQRPPQRIYRAELGVGESMAVRVVDNGEVVSETVVPGPVE